MFYYCPDCKAIYISCFQDVTVTYKNETYVSKTIGLLMEDINDLGDQNTLTYCIENYAHQNLKIYSPQLNKEETEEFFNMVDDVYECIYLEKLTAAQLVRLKTLLSVKSF